MLSNSLLGRRFGTLTVTEIIPHSRSIRVFCRNCKKHKLVSKGAIYRLKSCGCLRNKLISLGKRQHGHKPESGASPEYRAWRNAIVRTEKSKPGSEDYKLYRWRGIRMCPHFRKSFAAFLAAMGEKPSPKHSIDRVDNDKGYLCSVCCPPNGNLRWADARTQRLNQRRQIHRIQKNKNLKPLKAA